MDDEAGPEEIKKRAASTVISEVWFLYSWAGLARKRFFPKQRRDGAACLAQHWDGAGMGLGSFVQVTSSPEWTPQWAPGIPRDTISESEKLVSPGSSPSLPQGCQWKSTFLRSTVASAKASWELQAGQVAQCLKCRLYKHEALSQIKASLCATHW